MTISRSQIVFLSLAVLACMYQVDPVDALDISGFPRRIEGYLAKQISCGGYHTAVLTDLGEVHHWGFISEAHPEQVLFPNNVNLEKVSCGHSTCYAITDNGDVYRWGGENSPRDPKTRLLLQARAEKVEFPEPIKTVSVGFQHAIFVSTSGSVYTIGAGPRGQLGLGSDILETTEAVKIPPTWNSEIVDACAGGYHSLIRDNVGRVYAFGSNDYGQLGVGNKQASDSPQVVHLAEGVKIEAMACGGDHNLLLTSDKQVLAFGWGERGQLGTNSTLDQLIPVPILHPANFTVASISAGAYGHSIILSTEGEVATFGWCEDGQCGHLGLKEDILIPHKVSTLRNITSVCGGYKHTVVIRSDSKLLAFGDEFFGQLGPIRSALATDVGSLDDNVPDPDHSGTEETQTEEQPIIMLADHGENDGEKIRA